MKKPEQILQQLKGWIASVGLHDDRLDVFIEELCFVDRARRADLVHANGHLTAFEIKSSADNLSRWEGQQSAYLSSFDEVWLACHNKHLTKAMATTNPAIGILVVDDFAGMAVVRSPKKNQLVDAYQLSGFLWREEIDLLAKEHGIQLNRSDRIKEARRKICDALDINVIRHKVLTVLKSRYTPIKSSSSSSRPTVGLVS